MIARPPLLTSTTLEQLGHTAKRQRTQITLSPALPGIKWEHELWERVTASIGLPEQEDGDKTGLLSIFKHLLCTAPTNSPFELHDVHSSPSVCGDALQPDCVMSLQHKPIIPMTTGLILDLKPQDGLYENSDNVGKAIMYGRLCLQQLPQSLRSTVLVGLTDLCTITLIRVSLPSDPDRGEVLSAKVGQACPDVKQTLLQLLSMQPRDLHVEWPDLGPLVEIMDFLGRGATSNVYKALKDGQQVFARVNHAKAGPLMLICTWCFCCSQKVAKHGISNTLESECTVLRALQGVPGVPTLAHLSCLYNTIFTTAVLKPLTWDMVSVRHLHHKYHVLTQTLQVGINLNHG